MTKDQTFSARENHLLVDVFAALCQPVSLEQKVQDAYPLLQTLITADGLSICMAAPPPAADYLWTVADLPESLFARYPEVQQHDFVLQAVSSAPGRVLRDHRMLDGRARKSNLLYQQCREHGFPLEQVMSVLLPAEDGCHGGVTLYRARSHPFSEREERLLQRLLPSFGNLLRVCNLQRRTGQDALLLENLLSLGGIDVILFSDKGEVLRTRGTNALLARWFPDERNPGLPADLKAQVARMREHRPAAPQSYPTDKGTLHVSAAEVAYGPGRHFAILLQVSNTVESVPPRWKKILTSSEIAVTGHVLSGLDNQSIANERDLSIETVKKHLTHVFAKLNIPTRAMLIHQAMIERSRS